MDASEGVAGEHSTPCQEEPVPDHETLEVLLSLEPLLEHLHGTLTAADVPEDVVQEALAVVGEVYVVGRVDGVRDAVAQVAAEAERRGLRLMLAPDVANETGPPC
jgi:hypothetical protein